MAAGTGETTVDFGAGDDQVTVTVSRASVAAATTHVEAYLFPKDAGSGFSDHTLDEHLIDGPLVYAHSIVDGVGFSITAVSPRSEFDVESLALLAGKYTVRWVSTE